MVHRGLRPASGSLCAVRGGLAAIVSVLALSGCGFYVQELVEPEDLLNEPRLRYETLDLSPNLLAERMRSIDEHYAEPRTPAKVEYSLETCLASVSRQNEFGALWRASRACAWLAENHPSKSEQRRYAKLGAKFGREAVIKVANRVETFYYLGLCEKALIARNGLHSSGLLEDAEHNLKIAIALDRSFDHCGSDRALGELLLETVPYPLLNATSETGQAGVRAALEHLEKAVETCPDYGENHLVYARGLMDARKYGAARLELDRVMALAPPPDRSNEHLDWLEQANELLVDLQGK